MVCELYHNENIKSEIADMDWNMYTCLDWKILGVEKTKIPLWSSVLCRQQLWKLLK